MKRVWIIVIVLIYVPKVGQGQAKIFGLGYGKSFVTSDSTTFNLTVDLNRVPGQTEKSGGVYFVNNNFRNTGHWGYYAKPNMDINIGSGVSSSPNNVSLGLPLGIVYDFDYSNAGIISWYIEVSPDLVADKDFTNNLYYISLNTFLKYEVQHKQLLINLITGITNANGARSQTNIKETSGYGRLTVPLYIMIVGWNATVDKEGGNERTFKRINWVNALKFSYIYSDASSINSSDVYGYLTSRLNIYLTPNVGLNCTYSNGKDEPFFKRNNAVTIGISLAR